MALKTAAEKREIAILDLLRAGASNISYDGATGFSFHIRGRHYKSEIESYDTILVYWVTSTNDKEDSTSVHDAEELQKWLDEKDYSAISMIDKAIKNLQQQRSDIYTEAVKRGRPLEDIE